MSSVSVKTLREQLEISTQDVENAKALWHRADGMVMLLKHLLVEAEKDGADNVLDVVPDTEVA